MTALPRWQTKQAIQSQTVAEHMADTSTDVLREHLVLSALSDPTFDSEFMRDSVLHMYLNECRRGKSRQWYINAQQAFMAHHASWRMGFQEVFDRRREEGSKGQRTNTMGDWFALSQLCGETLPMEMIFREKLRHPKDPRPPSYFLVNLPKEGLYKEAFDLLYHAHAAKDSRWDELLSAMPLGSMTAALWDAYAEHWPDRLDKPIKSSSLEGHEWLTLLGELGQSKHAPELAKEVVKRVQSCADEKLRRLFTDDKSWNRGVIHEPLLSQALYAAMESDEKLRACISTQHLVHALNANPSRVKKELDTAVSNLPASAASCAVFSPPYVEQLSEDARKKALQCMAQTPKKYKAVLSQQFNKITSSNWMGEELTALLSTSYAQALLVSCVMKGWANTFLVHCAAQFPALTRELDEADFMDNYAFETIAMRHLVPGLAHKDAFALTSMAQSLGSNEDETLLVYQTAIEGVSSQKSLPIEGLVEASNDSAFPA